MYLITELCFLIFFCSSLAEFLTIENLHCKTICSSISTVAVLNNNQQLNCSITNPVLPKEIPLTPWSTEEEKPAFRPKRLQVGWYVYKNKRIALNITWLQKVSELETGYIKGYYLEIGQLKYDAVIKVSKLIEENKTPKNYIKFHFHCYGTTGKNIKPKEKIQVKLYSKPMHQSNSQEQVLEESITIPSCFEDERLSRIRDRHIATKECKSKWKSGASIESTTSVVASKQSPKKDNKDRYLTIGISIFIIICLCAVIGVCKQRQKKKKEIWKKDQKIRHIFMIADTNEDCEIWHTIAQKIKDSLHIKVETNWENSKMKYNNLVDWHTKIFQNTDAVIFLDGIRALKILDMNIEMRVAEKNEFETLIQYYLQMSESATKRTIFLTSEKEEEKYLVKRKRKNWKAFLMGNENFPESFYQYLQKYSLPVKMKTLGDKNKVNQNRTNRKDEVKTTYATSMV